MRLMAIQLLMTAATTAILLWPFLRKPAAYSAICTILVVLSAGSMLLYYFLGAPDLAN